MKAKVIYRDQLYENKIKTDLENAKPLIQDVLNEWTALDIGSPPADMFQLMTNSVAVFKNACLQLVELPPASGRFGLKKESYINQLELPDPAQLNKAISMAKRNTLTIVPGLWLVEGDTVVMNETEGEKLINGKTIYSDDPEKIALFEDLQKFTDLMNSINERLRGDFANPYDRDFFAGKFNLNQVGTGVYNAELSHDYLQLLLR